MLKTGRGRLLIVPGWGCLHSECCIGVSEKSGEFKHLAFRNLELECQRRAMASWFLNLNDIRENQSLYML